MKNSRRILVSVLNWGLGHATRSIPIIQMLQEKEQLPVLASDGEALAVLKKQFPQLQSIELPSYQIHYKYSSMVLNIGLQLPRLLRTISKERKFLTSIIQDYKIDALITDNRYGMVHPERPSVFMTHQLQINSANFLLAKTANRLNRYFLNQFDEIWVPDEPEYPGLAGTLSHPSFSLKKSIHYIGPLSRLSTTQGAETPYQVVALLSGPEPQRSYLEKQLQKQLVELQVPALLVRGKPLDPHAPRRMQQLDIIHYLDAAAIAPHLSSKALIIARSGYSTLMDMARIGCKNILFIPTPGQTEQLLLAQNCQQQQIAQIQQQNNINIAKALQNTQHYKGFSSSHANVLLEQTLDRFILKLQND